MSDEDDDDDDDDGAEEFESLKAPAPAKPAGA